jgi:hypothetical protein
MRRLDGVRVRRLRGYGLLLLMMNRGLFSEVVMQSRGGLTGDSRLLVVYGGVSSHALLRRVLVHPVVSCHSGAVCAVVVHRRNLHTANTAGTFHDAGVVHGVGV